MADFQDVVEVAQFTPIGLATKLAQGDQPADMSAMNEFMVRTEAQTPEAEKLKTEWNAWFNDLSWYERTLDNNILMQARNRLADYELANAKTEAEKESVKRIQKQSAQLELERAAMQGKPLPINVTTGKFLTDEKTVKDLKLKWLFLGGTGALTTGLASYAVPGPTRTPLAIATALIIAATGTYVAFTIED